MICKHIWLVLLLAVTYNLKSMEYSTMDNNTDPVAIEEKQTNDSSTQDNQCIITPNPLRIAFPALLQKGFIEWEEDPTSQKFYRINLATLIDNLCKNKELTPEQSSFLEKFKKLSLPCILQDSDIDTIESLHCINLFNITEDENGWYVAHGSLPKKVKPGCKLDDKTAREQLRKKKQ